MQFIVYLGIPYAYVCVYVCMCVWATWREIFQRRNIKLLTYYSNINANIDVAYTPWCRNTGRAREKVLVCSVRLNIPTLAYYESMFPICLSDIKVLFYSFTGIQQGRRHIDSIEAVIIWPFNIMYFECL